MKTSELSCQSKLSQQVKNNECTFQQEMFRLGSVITSLGKIYSHVQNPLFLNFLLPTRPDLMCCLGSQKVFQSVSWLFVHSVAVQSLLSLLTLTYESRRHIKNT